MAINYIKGEMLSANLLRGGADFAVETDLLYFDVGSGRVGVKNATPTEALDVTGNVLVSGDVTAGTGDIGGLLLNGGALATLSTDLVLTSVSGNVTFASDVKFTASDANIVGPGQKAAVTVSTTATTNVPYNLTNILPVPSISFDGSPGTEVPKGIFMTADGLTVFWVNAETPAANVDVYQTTLGIAFDMSSAGTATFNTVTGGIEIEAAHGITFNPNGLEMYISKYNTNVANLETVVEKFTLSIAFDLTSTITYIGNTIFAADDTYNFAPSFSSDGLKAYNVGIDALGTFINEYTISPAYALTSTPTFVNSYDVSAELAHASNYITVAIADDGLEILAAQYDGANNQIVRYDLSPAYDITSATLSTTATPGTVGVVNSMYFNFDGTELYWLDDAGFFYQYDTDTVLGETSAALNFSDSEKLITHNTGVTITGSLDFSGADALLTPPSYTTATLPAAPTEGGTVYDSTTKTLKYFDGTNWSGAGAVTGVNMYVLTAATINATPAEALDASSNPLDLADNTTWRFEANIVARRTDAGGVESSGYKFTGVIARDTGTASIVGIVAETIDAEDDATWSVTVDANVNSLRVQVTGAVGKDISWVVFVRTVEVSD